MNAMPRPAQPTVQLAVPAAHVDANIDAIDAIIRAHRELVRRMLVRASVADRDLCDCEQEVFVVVHRQLSEFESRASLRTWICRIALNLASEYRRRAYHRRETLDDSAGHLALASQDCKLKQR